MNYVIREMVVSETIVEKSKFIALLCPLTADGDFDFYMHEAKKTFKDARHYTYAFRYQNSEKASDDGEPQNTAGLPLLTLLRTHNFMNTALIVIRYFGGKKLGAGRLLRTYVEAGSKAIDLAVKYQEVPAFCYQIAVNISDFEKVKYALHKQGYEILEVDFSTLDVQVRVNVSVADALLFESLYNIKSKKEAVLLKEIVNE